ncbi:hypothetical protein GCM10027569_52270 [Flindersiella endophytica]
MARWPADRLPAFLRESRDRYLRQLGLDVLYALGDGPLPPENVAEAFNRELGLRGVVFNMWGTRSELVVADQTLPVSSQLGIGNRDEMVSRILGQVRTDHDGSKPLFIAVGIPAWELTPTDIGLVMGRRGGSPWDQRGCGPRRPVLRPRSAAAGTAFGVAFGPSGEVSSVGLPFVSVCLVRLRWFVYVCRQYGCHRLRREGWVCRRVTRRGQPEDRPGLMCGGTPGSLWFCSVASSWASSASGTRWTGRWGRLSCSFWWGC